VLASFQKESLKLLLKTNNMKIYQKLWCLLPESQRSVAIVMLGFIFVGMFVEMLGVGVIIPVLVIMAENDLASKYPITVPWLNMLGNPNHEELVIGGMVALVGVFAFKALFLAFFAWREATFVVKIQSNLSRRLFEGYMRQPYAFHLQRNSAQLIRNTLSHAAGIAGVIQQGLLLIMEVLVVLGISVLLLVVEPFGAVLVVSVLGLAGWGFNRLTRGYILRWGEAFQLHEGLRIQHVQQGLGGVKDVKLLGRESDFFAQYSFHNIGGARINKRRATLQALPRLFLELLAIIGLAALVVIMVGQSKPVEMLLPVVGLFAAAAFRVMPSVNRLLGVFQTMSFSLPVINTLYDEFQLLNAAKIPQPGQLMPFKNTLNLEQVSFQYPSTEASALSEINITIPFGASIGFIGSSGAGKSTLIDVVLGLLTPASGVVTVDGIDIQTSLRGWQDQIGYVPQSIYLTDDTLRRNIAFGLHVDQISEEAVSRAIHAAKLEQFVKELPQGLDTIVGERGIRLSGGQRQRIGIARALYHDPAVLVLDEATSSLDVETERGVMEAVMSLHGDKTILIVAHRFSTVKHCSYLYRLDNGEVVGEGKASVMLGEIPEQTSS
jgi:ATP-binding cassette, subfamily B, bacterial PglK